MLEKEGPKAGGCDTADPFFVGASFQKAEWSICLKERVLLLKGLLQKAFCYVFMFRHIYILCVRSFMAF